MSTPTHLQTRQRGLHDRHAGNFHSVVQTSAAMSDAQAYYDQVLGMGHTEANALAYTRQHYPDFIPQPTAQAPPPAPVPQPTGELQPAVMQPAAVTSSPVPSPQPATSPAVAQPSVALPSAVPAMASPSPAAAVGAPVLGATPQPYLPMVKSGPSPAMAYAAVALLFVGALLGATAQFNHEWLISNEDETTGLSAGLTTVRFDCSQSEVPAESTLTRQDVIDQCKVFTYGLFAEDMEAAAAENISADDLDDALVGNYEDYCDNTYTFASAFAMGNETVLADLAEARDTCLKTPAAGSTGGLVLWVASLTALLGTFVLGAGSIGHGLPAETEKHGKWVGMAAGVLMLLAVLVWWVLLPDTDSDASAGTGVWMTVLGGVLAIVASVLALLDQK